jgi:hypothetical protein
MLAQRGIGYLATITTLIVLPTVCALLWYFWTGDPTIRPLGLTREALRSYIGGGDTAGVTVLVDWDAVHTGAVTREQMQRALENAFRAKGVYVQVAFRESTGGTRVIYIVGSSVIGPFPQARAAEGINAAVEAYRMKVPFGSE